MILVHSRASPEPSSQGGNVHLGQLPSSKKEPWQKPAATHMGWSAIGHAGYMFTVISPTYKP